MRTRGDQELDSFSESSMLQPGAARRGHSVSPVGAFGLMRDSFINSLTSLIQFACALQVTGGAEHVGEHPQSFCESA